MSDARGTRRWWITVAVVAAVVVAISCVVGYTATTWGIGARATPAASVKQIPVGSTDFSLDIGGRTRTYIVYRPGSLPADKAVPLVVMLHGGFGSAAEAESYYGWDAEAAAHQFLVVYPDGVNHAWNAGGGCCGTPAQTGVDDVAFISAVVATVESQADVDRARVYATGISNGGIMAYRMACATDLFAAIGPDSATQLGACPAPARVSVIHIHGTADHNIPYEGGPGDGYARIDGPAVPALVAQWRAVDGCAAPAVATQGAVTRSTAQCPDGREVELITIAGAGHQWPGSPSRPVIQKLLHLDPPSTALNATDVIWQFFAAHPKPAAG